MLAILKPGIIVGVVAHDWYGQRTTDEDATRWARMVRLGGIPLAIIGFVSSVAFIIGELKG
jgi:hypothetical protein